MAELKFGTFLSRVRLTVISCAEKIRSTSIEKQTGYACLRARQLYGKGFRKPIVDMIRNELEKIENEIAAKNGPILHIKVKYKKCELCHWTHKLIKAPGTLGCPVGHWEYYTKWHSCSSTNETSHGVENINDFMSTYCQCASKALQNPEDKQSIPIGKDLGCVGDLCQTVGF